jgi:flagellar basal body-associated protein FliL
MPAAKGYRSYRGRPSKGKIALAVVLVLVIVAAVAVIVLQEYMVYDADGNVRLELPWQQTEEASEETPQVPENVDIVIQEPQTPAGARVSG